MTYEGPSDRLERQGSDPIAQAKRFGIPAVIGLVALLFVFQNTQEVEFEFLWFDFSMPLWTMLIGFALVGAVVLWGVQRRMARRRALDDA
jgi:uncharacterized integral membrane protein